MISIENRHPTMMCDLGVLRRFAVTATRGVGLKGDVGFRLTDDAEIRRLNRQFRRKDQATDVLSFPLEAGGYAGDIAISLDTARRQAGAQGHGLEVEVEILMLHGLLHLAGFDHATDQGEMRAREAVLQRRFQLPAGLIERAGRRKIGR